VRIAFEIMGGNLWTAGIVYQKNLFRLLKSYRGAAIDVYVVAKDGKQLLDSEAEELGAPCIADQPNGPQEKTALPPPYLSSQVSCKREKFLTEMLKARNIDVFVGSPYALDSVSIPTVSIAPDFQHRRLPENFSLIELDQRNAWFEQAFSASKFLVVPGEDVFRDCQQWYPEHISKVQIHHPIAYIDEQVFSRNPVEVVEKFSLPKKYFIVPNQFWKHKNHDVVWKALQSLATTHPEICVVCTGTTHDYRFPDHFARLWQLAAELGISQMIRYIGVIPHADLLQLMRYSLALINPSEFEGFAMSVDEAKHLGTRTILSDIAVHHEGLVPDAEYFQFDDASALTALLKHRWESSEPGPVAARETAARELYKDSLDENAARFLAICRKSLNGDSN
jgi:glycosyltransferase involved in cell wall biosynthesis